MMRGSGSQEDLPLFQAVQSVLSTFNGDWEGHLDRVLDDYFLHEERSRIAWTTDVLCNQAQIILAHFDLQGEIYLLKTRMPPPNDLLEKAREFRRTRVRANTAEEMKSFNRDLEALRHEIAGFWAEQI
jgi:hypothetical protein